jgi:pilus assembly protein CpaB
MRRRFVRRRLLPPWIRRHPGVYWVAALSLAALSAHAIASAVADAESARERWGETRFVVVAQRRLEVGDVVDADAIEVESWPLAMLPRSAVETADAVVGRTVVEVIEPGEVVVAGRLAPDGLRGAAALIPPGWRALAVPVGSAVVPLSVGDRVDLVAAIDGAREPSFVLAANARVIAVDERSVSVAVPADDAPRVALGIVTGSVVPALRAG